MLAWNSGKGRGRVRRVRLLSLGLRKWRSWRSFPPSSPHSAKSNRSSQDMSSKGVSNIIEGTSPGRLLYTSPGQFNREVPPLSEGLSAGVLVESGLSARELTAQLRWTKSPAELALMEKAGSIGATSFAAAVAESVEEAGRGRAVAESAVGSRVELESRRQGALGLAYPPVVAAGNRANTIHYLANDQIVAPGDLVLMDAGVDYHGYVSDITRTWAPHRNASFAYLHPSISIRA